MDPKGQATGESTEVVKQQATEAKSQFAAALRGASNEGAAAEMVIAQAINAVLGAGAVKTFDTSDDPHGLIKVGAGFTETTEKGGGLWYSSITVLLCVEFSGSIRAPGAVTMTDTTCPPPISGADPLYPEGTPDVVAHL
ncbi:hypothetical protein FHR32_008213 [Streptosporangium album]|uniref:Uncharacterized protein n=1 Tax=Streptosporangium album TaxID=47479 RepID=A0A7W7WDK7_9ACTN|nr:hypothetical protein [Streptosporangium album]MBB4943812.1 hypothetical protein [Streptosporangium album]